MGGGESNDVRLFGESYVEGEAKLSGCMCRSETRQSERGGPELYKR